MYSKGITWIDDCRIGTDGGTKRDRQSNKITSTNPNLKPTQSLNRTGHKVVQLNMGRFPANILVSDDMLNDGVRYNTGGKQFQNYPSKNKTYSVNIGGGIHTDKNTYNDKGTNSRYYDIDKWFNTLIDV